MKHLWLDHCVRLASTLATYALRPHVADSAEMRDRVQIKLSCEEFQQLSAEVQGMQAYLRPDAMQTLGKIFLLGVAFVPDSDEYICGLHHSLKSSERSRIYLENAIGLGATVVRDRCGVGRGVHVPQTPEPGANRGGST